MISNYKKVAIDTTRISLDNTIHDMFDSKPMIDKLTENYVPQIFYGDEVMMIIKSMRNALKNSKKINL